jgi:predicted DNA-binding transcriptional regulator YafY
MSRAQRLLELLQALRRRRAPITGLALSQELGVSLRTLYRDVETLRAQGAEIEGEAGLGYVLRPGFTLPPLMFSRDEIDALALGLRWVAKQGDRALAASARNALAKISAVLPQPLDEAIAASPLLPARTRPAAEVAALPALREAIAKRRKVALDYVDGAGASTRRVVWPIVIGFFEHTMMLAAWCELRGDFRHFRLERVRDATSLEEMVPTARGVLMRRWREQDDRKPPADGI